MRAAYRRLRAGCWIECCPSVGVVSFGAYAACGSEGGGLGGLHGGEADERNACMGMTGKLYIGKKSEAVYVRQEECAEEEAMEGRCGGAVEFDV